MGEITGVERHLGAACGVEVEGGGAATVRSVRCGWRRGVEAQQSAKHADGDECIVLVLRIRMYNRANPGPGRYR
jgi:hypothetical protein